MRRAKKIAPDVKGTLSDMEAADKGVELDALASMSHKEQRQAVDLVKSKTVRNFRETRDFIQGDNDDRRKAEIAKQLEALQRAWKRPCPETRKAFLEWLDRAARGEA